MHLRDRITIGLLIMTLSTVLLGIFTVGQYASVFREFSKLKEEISPALLSIIPVKSSLATIISTIDTSLARKRPLTMKELAPQFQDANKQLQNYIHYSRYLGPEKVHESRRFKEQTMKVITLATTVVTMIEKGQPWIQTVDVQHRLHIAYESLVAQAVPQEAYITSQMQVSEHLIQASYRRTTMFVWIAIIIALILSLAVSRYLHQHIEQEIERRSAPLPK